MTSSMANHLCIIYGKFFKNSNAYFLKDVVCLLKTKSVPFVTLYSHRKASIGFHD